MSIITKELKKGMVEQSFLNKLLYIGNEIPTGVANDKRSKFVLLGTPQELIDEINIILDKSISKEGKCCKELNDYPMGVSEWKKHGIKYKYWSYFKKKILEGFKNSKD